MSLHTPRVLVVTSLPPVIALLAIAGCCSMPGSTPPPPPPPPQEVIATDPPLTDQAEPDTGAAAATDGPLVKAIGPTHVASIEAATAALDSAQSAAQFEIAYRRLIELSHTLEGVLQPACDAANDGTGEWISEDLFDAYPVYQLGYGAEGMAVLVEMNAEPVKAAAARTPEPTDDAFITMLSLMYDDARGTGWNNLGIRTWDYGGCSVLGSGLHRQILASTDTAAASGDLFAAEIADVRQRVLDDVIADNTEFPYCVTSDGGTTPTPTSTLRAEVEGILAEVQLTPDERTAVERRLAERFGGKASGAVTAPSTASQPTVHPTREPVTPRSHGKKF